MTISLLKKLFVEILTPVWSIFSICLCTFALAVGFYFIAVVGTGLIAAMFVPGII